jgi:phosphoribosyl 1,2-cyclic phosphate phosphodiesterase
VLILNCIRKFDPHPAHFILPDVIKLFEELKPKKLFLTHISHHLGLHDIEDKQLPPEYTLPTMVWKLFLKKSSKSF